MIKPGIHQWLNSLGRRGAVRKRPGTVRKMGTDLHQQPSPSSPRTLPGMLPDPSKCKQLPRLGCEYILSAWPVSD